MEDDLIPLGFFCSTILYWQLPKTASEALLLFWEWRVNPIQRNNLRLGTGYYGIV